MQDCDILVSGYARHAESSLLFQSVSIYGRTLVRLLQNYPLAFFILGPADGARGHRWVDSRGDAEGAVRRREFFHHEEYEGHEEFF